MLLSRIMLILTVSLTLLRHQITSLQVETLPNKPIIFSSPKEMSCSNTFSDKNKETQSNIQNILAIYSKHVQMSTQTELPSWVTGLTQEVATQASARAGTVQELPAQHLPFFPDRFPRNSSTTRLSTFYLTQL